MTFLNHKNLRTRIGLAPLFLSLQQAVAEIGVCRWRQRGGGDFNDGIWWPRRRCVWGEWGHDDGSSMTSSFSAPPLAASTPSPLGLVMMAFFSVREPLDLDGQAGNGHATNNANKWTRGSYCGRYKNVFSKSETAIYALLAIHVFYHLLYF